MQDRIRHARMHDRLMSPEQAAGLISGHQTVAMSGFTGAGYPKSVPQALAARMEAAAAAGGPFRIKGPHRCVHSTRATTALPCPRTGNPYR